MEAQGTTEPVVVEPVVAQPSALPSENIDLDTSGFEINDDLKSRFKDGKLNGRFGSVNEILDKLKEAEDRNANLIRDQKNGEQQSQEQQSQEDSLLATQQLQETTVYDMLPEFMSNNMQLTPEMETKAAEVGIDIRDLKLGALEIKERVGNAHAVLGSADEYNAMLAWGKDNMSEAQMKAFDVDVSNGSVSEYAIKGLYAEYKANEGNGARVSGQPANLSAKGYTDRRELFADRKYLQSAAGKRDTAAQEVHKAKLSLTTDAVVYGR